MAGEWIETVLEEIAANDDRAFAMGPFGSNIKSENYRKSGIPVIRGTNLGECGEAPFIAEDFVFLDEEKADNLASSNCSPNDIVFVAQGTVGKVGIVPSDTQYRRFVLSQNLMKVTVDLKRADPRFVFYFYRSNAGQHEIMSRVNPTGVPCISKPLTSLRQFGIQLPSDVNEQRAIAHILGTLDDKIELNRRMNETLEAMARALFKSWFLVFDPVRAKAEGRNPGLPKPLAKLFPDRFEDSELGEIPAGWKVTVLQEALAELETGGRPKGGVSEYTEGIPSIGAESIVGLGVFDYSKTKYVPHEFFDRMTKGRVKSRDVLLYKDGGRPGEFEPHVAMFGEGFPFHTCAINEHVYRMRAKRELGQNFLFFWLSSEPLMEEMRIKGTGVAIPGLNSTQVKSLTTVVPPDEIARAFDVLVEPWIARLLASCNESRILSELRDALLPKLISGKLRVGDAARVVANAV